MSPQRLSPLEDFLHLSSYDEFVIEKDGSIGDIRIVRGVDRDLDKEAVRLCKCLPKFSPGRNADGEPVRVWYTIPISFRLQAAKEDESEGEIYNQ